MTRRSLIVGRDRFVVGPWHDDPLTAYVSVAPSASVLTSRASVERCIEQLRLDGYHGAVTAALHANDAHVFGTAGFAPRERLHVLRHDLSGDLPPSDHRLRRARRRDRATVLEVDRLAFESFWHLGPDGLDEALNATSTVRFRVAEEQGVVLGYAVTGKALDVGYLQRLAVHPDHLRRGIGAALVHDALRWLKRRRGRMVLVNTQESNEGALALYRHLGFRLEPEHLTVLSWDADA